MEETTCMNVGCGATTSTEWKRGWALRSGGFANLCDECGSAYEQSVYCDTFHSKESGWRECKSCGKQLHCGCIASKSSLELLDSGGVECINCAKNAELPSIPSGIPKETNQQSTYKEINLPGKGITDEKMNEHGTLTLDNTCERRSTSTDTKTDDEIVDKIKPMKLVKSIEDNMQRDCLDESLESIKREQPMLQLGEVGSTSFSNLNQAATLGPSREDNKGTVTDKEMYESLAHACLGITLGTSNPSPVPEACYTSGTSNPSMPLRGLVAEGRETSKFLPPFQQGQRSRHLLPKPPRMSPNAVSEASKDMVSQIRVARPPGEGRGRNQLLPRYWPRITDQELQQISGDSNSTIVPLFEKVLSASDAGRIGRLVLPKACAEAYFPSISQPEGLPLKIQDAKGKDWVFQFRFWPNNNSRMYVLEGVTPCIQSMQLQAGDTVTFSRIDPEGKLVMGFRKAASSMAMQETQTSAAANGALSKETFYSGIENLPIISGYSGLLQSLKGSADPHLSALSDHLNSSEGDIGWFKTDKHGGRSNDGFLLPERKRTRNIGSKSKRLHIDTEDALELKLTWEEAQDLLRPPPAVKPSIVVIEEHEFEEYEEPPVFGKRTIFTARLSGGQDQWGQCDNCYRWRRLPVDVLLPPRWTCAENSWDPRRSSCAVPDEMNSRELENLLRMNRDFKKRKMAGNYKPNPEPEPSGLDALATAAVLGDDGNPGTSSIATTTKHPRHRPGCTCIVCIQPPSGKGPKHKPTCTCNVCMTVKRRFKTLMMRKKKRQSEREAETTQKKPGWSKDELEVDSSLRRLLPQEPTDRDPMQSNDSEASGQAKILAEGKGNIDLNCHPDREEDPQSGPVRMSMMSLLQVASLPLETYLKQNGLTSLVSEQQASSSSHALPQATAGESEGRPPDDGYIASVVRERESAGDEGFSAATDQPRNSHV